MHLLAVNGDGANQFVLLQHRDDEQGPDAGKHTEPTPSVSRFNRDIGNLHHLLRIDEGEEPVARASFRDWLGSQRVGISGRQVVKRRSPEFLAIV